MTTMSGSETSLELLALGLLDLPQTWLVDLIQHVASGPDGLSSAAALSQTCKPFYDLSESYAVTYRNVYVNNTIISPNHAAWKWLAKRRGCVSGLVLKVLVDSGEELVYYRGEQQEGQAAGWEGPWQSLATVQDLQLALRIDDFGLVEPEDACQWLKQHSHLLANFSTDVTVDSEQHTLQSLCEALAPCKALELGIFHPSLTVFDISSLVALSSCLVKLEMNGDSPFVPFDALDLSDLRGVTTATCLTKLTGLALHYYSLTPEDPWPTLAALSSLKELQLTVHAYGDPSPLSALTGLTSLSISGYYIEDEVEDELLSSFSSLQPLSTMQQLVKLDLVNRGFSATSLHGLAGLSNLRSVMIYQTAKLRSLEGLPGGVETLYLSSLEAVENMAGLENLSSLRNGRIDWHGDASLQRLSSLNYLSSLQIFDRPRDTGSLSCLEGIEGVGKCLKVLELHDCMSLHSLSGIEGLTTLEDLKLICCGVTNLQPLAGMAAPGLKRVYIWYSRGLKEKPLVLPPHIEAVLSISRFSQ